jgi:hypothetical protein
MADPGSEGASPGQPQPRAEPAWATDKLERFRALEEFRAAGLLSEAEFEEQKAKLRWTRR